MEISLYSTIIIVFDFIGLLLYVFSIFKGRDIANPLSHIMKTLLTYSILLCMYLPFFVSLILLIKRNQLKNYEDFIITNFFWLTLIVTPLTVFNDIWNPPGSVVNISHEDLVDTSVYDDEGNLIKGQIKEMSSGEIKIKERAAKSEYNERSDINRGIYN